jgi:ABC-type transporter Mla maintaining outer membrane lipid asymmetry ATPase subunit MlaF
MASDIVPAIELRHVTKRFGNRNVLDDLTLSIPARQGL